MKQMIWDSFRSSKNEIISIDKEETHKNKIVQYQLFKLLTDEIDDHLNDKNHGLSLIKNEFNYYFVNFFDCQEKLPQTKQAAENLIIGIKFFVRVFTECLMILYKIEELSEYLNNIYKSEQNLFRFDNLFLFATNFIFSQRIYEIIMYSQRKFFDQKEEQIFSENLLKIKDENIEFFEIPAQFTLNEMTLNKLQKFPEKEIANIPYNSLINMLTKIELMSSPIFQLKLLCQISEGIEKEIKGFYENCQKSFIDELDTDILLAIHIYIIAKSGIKHLISILNLIERIISEKLKMELPGYYLTLFKAAALYIKEISI
ncbi:MAG: hypothetical protein KDC72_09335 [Bacteroidetes bacterium]|nr:hypothetical protein [Bacteroidota bacterium]